MKMYVLRENTASVCLLCFANCTLFALGLQVSLQRVFKIQFHSFFKQTTKYDPENIQTAAAATSGQSNISSN